MHPMSAPPASGLDELPASTLSSWRCRQQCTEQSIFALHGASSPDRRELSQPPDARPSASMASALIGSLPLQCVALNHDMEKAALPPTCRTALV